MSDSSNSLPPITKIIWGGLTVSQLVYGVVGTTVDTTEMDAPDDVLLIVLLIMGLVSLSVSVIGVPMFLRVESKLEVFTPFVVQWALVESVAVYGLVGRFQGASDVFFYAMLGMALSFMLLLFPTEARAKKFLRENASVEE